MNKIKIEVIDERVKIEFEFENAEVAKQSLKDEMFIDDVIGVLDRDEEPQYDDNDMLRAEVTTQVAKTSTKTLKRIIEVVDEELKKRELCSMK